MWKIYVIATLINIVKTLAITNKNFAHSTGSVRKFRHIGDTNNIINKDWEPGLKEATVQALYRESYSDSNLQKLIHDAPILGKQDKATPFGDIAVLARGQLYANFGGYVFVQDPYQNDCDGCHNVNPRCGLVQCGIWRPRNNEQLLALWTIKRIRHRDYHGRYIYQIEYTISTINTLKHQPYLTEENRFNYAVPGHVFLLRTNQQNIPHNHNAFEYQHGSPISGNNRHEYEPKYYQSSSTIRYTSTRSPPHYYRDKDSNVYKNLLEILHKKTAQTQNSDGLTLSTKSITNTITHRPSTKHFLFETTSVLHSTKELRHTTSATTRNEITTTIIGTTESIVPATKHFLFDSEKQTSTTNIFTTALPKSITTTKITTPIKFTKTSQTTLKFPILIKTTETPPIYTTKMTQKSRTNTKESPMKVRTTFHYFSAAEEETTKSETHEVSAKTTPSDETPQLFIEKPVRINTKTPTSSERTTLFTSNPITIKHKDTKIQEVITTKPPPTDTKVASSVTAVPTVGIYSTIVYNTSETITMETTESQTTTLETNITPQTSVEVTSEAPHQTTAAVHSTTINVTEVTPKTSKEITKYLKPTLPRRFSKLTYPKQKLSSTTVKSTIYKKKPSRKPYFSRPTVIKTKSTPENEVPVTPMKSLTTIAKEIVNSIEHNYTVEPNILDTTIVTEPTTSEAQTIAELTTTLEYIPTSSTSSNTELQSSDVPLTSTVLETKTTENIFLTENSKENKRKIPNKFQYSYDDIFGTAPSRSNTIPSTTQKPQHTTSDVEEALFGDNNNIKSHEREPKSLFNEMLVVQTPKIIFSDFYEPSTPPYEGTVASTVAMTTAPPFLVTDDIGTSMVQPATSQSYLTSISFEIKGNKTEGVKETTNSNVKYLEGEIEENINKNITKTTRSTEDESENSSELKIGNITTLNPFDYLAISVYNHARSFEYLSKNMTITTKKQSSKLKRRRSFVTRKKRPVVNKKLEI